MSRTHVSRPARAVTRRTALGALAGTALVAAATSGCGNAAQPVGRPLAQPASTPDEDPDEALLRSVVAEIDAVVALLGAVRRRERSLRPRVDRLLSVHAAHRDLLAAALPSDAPPSTVPSARPPRGGTQAVDAAITRREESLAARLARAAGEAESGTFARALASMSAGVQQQLAARGEVAR